MRSARLIICALLACLVVVPAAASRSRHELVERRLGNGVTLIAAPNPWNGVVAMAALVDAGSKYDPPELRGLARVTNEFLICGTSRMARGELEDLIDSRGIRISAYTTEDRAEVHVVADIAHFDAVLDVMAALVVEPAFEERDLAKAQSVVFAEQERSQTDPGQTCDAKINELMFAGHPYAFPPYGTKDGVAAVTRDDVSRFYADRYRGGSIVVAAVGDFDMDDAIRKLGERFASCASGSAPERAPVLPERTEPLSLEFHRAVPKGYVGIGFDVPPVGSEDCAAVSLLTSVLGDANARFGLLQEALLSGAADEAGAYCPQRVDRGRLVLFASTADVDAALDGMGDVIEDVRTNPVSADVLKRAKSRLRGITVLDGEPNVERARRLAGYELARLGLDRAEKMLREVEAMQADDLRRVAVKYLVNPVTVVLRPGRSPRTQL